MQRQVVKHIMIAFLVVIYINRGLFISTAFEVDNQGIGEINSVAELILQLITDKENGIDEDGNMQSDCNSVKIIQYDFSEQINKNFELANLTSKNINKLIPYKENFLSNDFCTQIDHPPEV